MILCTKNNFKSLKALIIFVVYLVYIKHKKTSAVLVKYKNNLERVFFSRVLPRHSLEASYLL